MDSMTLFIASLAVSCIGALASVLLIKADNAAKTAGCLIGAVAAVLSFVAGIQAVLGDVTSVDTIVFFPFAHFQLLLNQLSGLFVALISVLAFAGSIYGLNYFDEYPGKKGRAGFFFNTFVASMMLVITADEEFEQHFYLKVIPNPRGVTIKVDSVGHPYRTPAMRAALLKALAAAEN